MNNLTRSTITATCYDYMLQITPVFYHLQLLSIYCISPTFRGGRRNATPEAPANTCGWLIKYNLLDSRRWDAYFLVDWEEYDPEEQYRVNAEDILDPTLINEFHRTYLYSSDSPSEGSFARVLVEHYLDCISHDPIPGLIACTPVFNYLDYLNTKLTRPSAKYCFVLADNSEHVFWPFDCLFDACLVDFALFAWIFTLVICCSPQTCACLWLWLFLLLIPTCLFLLFSLIKLHGSQSCFSESALQY